MISFGHYQQIGLHAGIANNDGIALLNQTTNCLLTPRETAALQHGHLFRSVFDKPVVF
jgi:hypothetical protein